MPSGGSTPKNHHFVPQLLQRQWADPIGQVQCWRWLDRRIAPFRTTPKNIMSQTHLYRAEHIDTPGIYEEAFSQMEAAAAPVLAKFCDPARPRLTPEDFEAWAIFVLAQRNRVPSRITWAKQHAMAGFTAMFDKHDPDFELFKPEDRFATPLQYIEDYYPNVLANFPLHTLVGVALDPKHVRRLCGMKWFVGRRYPHPIILGDDPVMLIGNLHGDECLIGMPISPTEIFFAASNDEMRDRVVRLGRKEVGIQMNAMQARQAERFIIGDVVPRFLERRLRKPPSTTN